jgi:hypothetical protein
VDRTTPERTPIEGGIYTTDPAFDLVWRLIFSVSYRFGWDPGERRGRRGGGPGHGGSWYDDGNAPEPGGGEEEEEEEEEPRAPADNWDDGDW